MERRGKKKKKSWKDRETENWYDKIRKKMKMKGINNEDSTKKREKITRKRLEGQEKGNETGVRKEIDGIGKRKREEKKKRW